MRKTSPGSAVPRPEAIQASDTLQVLAQTARAVAAADDPDGALLPIVRAVRQFLHAEGAAILRVEGSQLVPAAADGMDVQPRPMTEAELTPVDGGGYPLVLGGRLEGVLLVSGVAPNTLAAQERALAALIDLGAVALRAARRGVERGQQRRDQELRSLERLSAASTPVSALALGAGSVRQAQPERYADAVSRYAALLDAALEARAYRIEQRLEDRLRALAEHLGFARAGPRDVVEIHTAALRERMSGVVAARAQAYLEEARVLVLELMGYLAAYYRAHAMIPASGEQARGAPRQPDTQPLRPARAES